MTVSIGASFAIPQRPFAEASQAMDGFGTNIRMIADSRSPWSLRAPFLVDEYTQMQADSQAPGDGVISPEASRPNTRPILYDQWLLVPQQAPYIGSEGPASHPGHWNSSAVPAPRGVIDSFSGVGTVDPRALEFHSRGWTS